MMRYDAIWINNVFLGIVYKKGSFIPLGIKFCSRKRHPITIAISYNASNALFVFSSCSLLHICACPLKLKL